MTGDEISRVLQPFNDRDKISSWAKADLAYAIDQGILSGRSKTTIAPADQATRAETTAILKRFLDQWWEQRFHN